MRISIWQQFSSNHSGWFWTIGTFKTLEESRSAYNELRHILFEIDRWHREHKDESAALNQTGNYKAIPPEAAFALHYNVEWPHTIDWTGFGGYWLEDWPGYSSLRPAQIRSEELIDQAVTIVGRVVTVGAPDQTWMTTQPFQALLERLGAKTIGYDHKKLEELPAAFELHRILRFAAPDTTTADKIESAIRAYQGTSGGIPPWQDEANFREVVGTSKLMDQEVVDNLKKNWQRRSELYSLTEESRTGRTMSDLRLAANNTGMPIIRDKLNFTWIDIEFYADLGLYALFAYLEVLGCTDIDFEYSEQALSDIT